MKTYLKFRSIGMTQSEAMFCAAYVLRDKEGSKAPAKDVDLFLRLKDKYRETYTLMI